MISVREIEELHRLLIDKFGGAHGIREPEVRVTDYEIDVTKVKEILTLKEGQ